MHADTIQQLRERLGREKVRVLTDVFAKSTGFPPGVQADRYRADHPQHMEILDRLQSEQLFLRRQQANSAKYEVIVFALPVLLDERAARLVRFFNNLYTQMRTTYRERLAAPITVGELTAALQQEGHAYDTAEVIEGLYYMCQSHGVWSVMSDGFPYADDATICVAEEVLRHRDFDSLLEQFYSWNILKPRGQATGTAAEQARASAQHARGFGSPLRQGNHDQGVGPLECKDPAPLEEEAPEGLRSFVLFHLSYIGRLDIHRLRDLVSHTIRHIPNPSNQSVAEIWNEVESAVRTCEWFLVYDLIEEIYRALRWSDDKQEGFVAEVNEFLREHDIGWQLRTAPIAGVDFLAPEIVIRGSDAFETPVTAAMQVLQHSAKNAAQSELREALHDLSRRPLPDLTGAVHHAMAALECVAADVCGETGETLGQVVRRHPDRFPAPLGDAVSKLYGFASDRARHVTEGKAPAQKDAELVVTIAAALTTFLLG